MKKHLISILLICFSIFANTASADKYAIKLTSCKLRSSYVKDQSHFGRLGQAKHFSTRQAAIDYMQQLTPKLKKMRPRIILTLKQ